MSIEEFQQLNEEKRIDYTSIHEPIAWREMRPRWFYIIYKVDDFYVELKFDENNKDRLAINARAITANSFKHYLKNDYYAICNEFWPLYNSFEDA